MDENTIDEANFALLCGKAWSQTAGETEDGLWTDAHAIPTLFELKRALCQHLRIENEYEGVHLDPNIETGNGAYTRRITELIEHKKHPAFDHTPYLARLVERAEEKHQNNETQTPPTEVAAMVHEQN